MEDRTQNRRWLAVYINDHGQIGAAEITPATADDFPYGVDVSDLGMEGAASGVALIEMPNDPDFHPAVFDCDQEDEVTVQAIAI